MAGKNFYSPGLSIFPVTGESLAGAPTNAQIQQIAAAMSSAQFISMFTAIGALPLLVGQIVLNNTDMVNAGGATLKTVAVGAVGVTHVPLMLFGHSDLTAGAYVAGSNIRIRYQGTATDILNDGAGLVDASATHHYKWTPNNLGFTNAANVATGKDLQLTLATANNGVGNAANTCAVFVFYTSVPN